MSLTDVLPVEPGDPDHRATELPAPAAARRCERGQRVVGGEDPARRSAVPREELCGTVVMTTAPHAPARKRPGGELAAVGALAP